MMELVKTNNKPSAKGAGNDSWSMCKGEFGTRALCEGLLIEVTDAVRKFKAALPETIHIDLEAESLDILEHLRKFNREKFLGERGDNPNSRPSDALGPIQNEDFDPFPSDD